MSIFPAVAVIVGAPDVPNLTPVNVAVPPPVVAACLSNNTKDLPAVAVGIVKVQAVDAVNVAVCTVPSVNVNVADDVTVPIALSVSVILFIVKFCVTVTLFANETFPETVPPVVTKIEPTFAAAYALLAVVAALLAAVYAD